MTEYHSLETKVSVIIPTLNAGKLLPSLVACLKDQSLRPHDIIVVDSSSVDDTIDIAERYGCKAKVIERKEFNHGGTRNLGAKLADGEIYIFLTQDALPYNSEFIKNLVLPIIRNISVASSARQIAYNSANPIEKFSREFNYPDKFNIRTINDVDKFGFKLFFFSDVASAINADIFWSFGGFSEKLIAIEDMYLCAQLLNNNYSVAYSADAIVYHSHNYSNKKLFQRYFDTGVFHRDNGDVFNGLAPSGEGFRFIQEAFSHLFNTGNIGWMPQLLLETVIKYSAFRLGLSYNRIPCELCRKLSNQKAYWNC